MTTYFLFRKVKRTGRYCAMGRELYLCIWLWRRMRIFVAHMSMLIILAPRKNKPVAGREMVPGTLFFIRPYQSAL